MPILENYLKALEVFKNPEFEEQDLFLHDWKDLPKLIEREKRQPELKYTDHGIHWGYVDDMVSSINKNRKEYSSFYAYIIGNGYDELTEDQTSNSRYSIVKFKEIKDAVLKIMNK